VHLADAVSGWWLGAVILDRLRALPFLKSEILEFFFTIKEALGAGFRRFRIMKHALKCRVWYGKLRFWLFVVLILRCFFFTDQHTKKKKKKKKKSADMSKGAFWNLSIRQTTAR
jgi:hypothetical protein